MKIKVMTGLLRLWVAGVVLFLVAPIAVIVPISLSSASYLTFPPPGLSTRWFDSYFSDPSWISATEASISVAACTSMLSLVLGGAAAMALARTRFRGAGVARLVLLAPLIVPSIIVAIAVYRIYSALGLLNTFPGVVLAHTVLATPFVVTILTAGLRALEPALEEASASMGASWFRTFRSVVLPQLMPSVVTAAVFAFITSWDEVVMVLFIGGTQVTTLPLKMFNYLATEINPTIAAVSTLLTTAIVIGFMVRAVIPWLVAGYRRLSGRRAVS